MRPICSDGENQRKSRQEHGCGFEELGYMGKRSSQSRVCVSVCGLATCLPLVTLFYLVSSLTR